MATFDELMEQFRNPGEAGIPENFADELMSTYQADLSVRDAAVQERETRLADKEKEILAAQAEALRLKAVNYDLLMAAPKSDSSDDNGKPGGDDNAPRGVDSLFE
jgi:hypothetical protein